MVWPIAYLCVLFVSAIYNGGTAHLSHLGPMAKEGPTADLLVSNHILQEQNPSIETQGKLLKELQILKKIVVRITEKNTMFTY